MDSDFFKKHTFQLRAVATRVSIEREVPLDLCLAIAAAASQHHSLLVAMKHLGSTDDHLEVAGLNFLGTWELVGQAFDLPKGRCSGAAMDLLGDVTEAKKKFAEEYTKKKVGV